MRIIVDVDGVLADFTLGFTTVANSMFGSPISTGCDQPVWALDNGLSAEDYASVWSAITQSPSFWRDLQPIASLDDLRRLGALSEVHDVYFVTDRQGVQAKAQTEAWLVRHDVPRPTVVLSKAKGEVARAVRADALVDDKADNAVFTQYYSPETTVYLIDRLYNRFDPATLGSSVVRIKTFGDFLDRVEGAWRNLLPSALRADRSASWTDLYEQRGRLHAIPERRVVTHDRVVQFIGGSGPDPGCVRPRVRGLRPAGPRACCSESHA